MFQFNRYPHDPKEVRLSLLELWQERTGPDASLDLLIQALRKTGMNNTAETLIATCKVTVAINNIMLARTLCFNC